MNDNNLTRGKTTLFCVVNEVTLLNILTISIVETYWKLKSTKSYYSLGHANMSDKYQENFEAETKTCFDNDWHLEEKKGFFIILWDLR